MSPKSPKKRNISVSLPGEIIQKAETLATRRGMSISALVSQQIEALAAEEATYAQAENQALSTLELDLDLGNVRATRDQLHER